MTNRDSFEKCQQWVEELHEKANPEIIISILGNKIDLDSHAVTKEEVEAYCQKQGGLRYYEVSAKQNLGIDHVFKEIAERLPNESTNRKKIQLKNKQKENSE